MTPTQGKQLVIDLGRMAQGLVPMTLIPDKNGWFKAVDLMRVVQAMQYQTNNFPDQWMHPPGNISIGLAAYYDLKMPHIVFDRRNGDFCVVVTSKISKEPRQLTSKELMAIFPAICSLDFLNPATPPA